MLIIAVNPQDMSVEDKETLKNKLKEFFEQDVNKEAGVTSLHFQTIEKKQEQIKAIFIPIIFNVFDIHNYFRVAGGEGGGTIEHISGTPYIEETLLGMKFRISPEAFFQINSAGAEALYRTAIELAAPTTDTALLDVCCGTGTIGLAFSKVIFSHSITNLNYFDVSFIILQYVFLYLQHCDEVLGIEMVPNAIKDAKENAKENNITNCEFFVGKAEDILVPVINRTTKPNIVAVIDPPRAGLREN